MSGFEDIGGGGLRDHSPPRRMNHKKASLNRVDVDISLVLTVFKNKVTLFESSILHFM